MYTQYLFKCRAKAEQVQDELRNKITVLKCAPVDFVAEGKALLADLQKIYVK
jgi:hypothetical protein